MYKIKLSWGDLLRLLEALCVACLSCGEGGEGGVIFRFCVCFLYFARGFVGLQLKIRGVMSY